MEAGSEAPAADVKRYEALRHRALGDETSGWRLGLAVVQRQGVAAWLRACRDVPPVPPVPAPRYQEIGQVGDELVSVLAGMALACIKRGRGRWLMPAPPK